MNLDWLNTPLGFIVTALAAFRITRLVVADAFPFGPLRHAIIDWANRRWLAMSSVTREERGEILRLEPDGVNFPYRASVADWRKVNAYERNAPLAYLVTCYWCAGLYVSVVCVLLACTGAWWFWLATPLAVSAVVGLLGARD